MTDQETIDQAVIGKRIVAISWLPIPRFKNLFSLESLTLEDGTVLKLQIDDYWNYVMVKVEEGENAK